MREYFHSCLAQGNPLDRESDADLRLCYIAPGTDTAFHISLKENITSRNEPNYEGLEIFAYFTLTGSQRVQAYFFSFKVV